MRTHADMQEQTQRYSEINDCSVRAVATAFNLSYGRARRLVSRYTDRVEGVRGPDSILFTLAVGNIASVEGRKVVTREDVRGLTLSQFYKAFGSKGNWIVCIKGHAVGIQNGRICDWTGDDSVIRRKTAKVGYRADMAAVEII